jgi:hypothetical protein
MRPAGGIAYHQRDAHLLPRAPLRWRKRSEKKVLERVTDRLCLRNEQTNQHHLGLSRCRKSYRPSSMNDQLRNIVAHKQTGSAAVRPEHPEFLARLYRLAISIITQNRQSQALLCPKFPNWTPLG